MDFLANKEGGGDCIEFRPTPPLARQGQGFLLCLPFFPFRRERAASPKFSPSSRFLARPHSSGFAGLDHAAAAFVHPADLAHPFPLRSGRRRPGQFMKYLLFRSPGNRPLWHGIRLP
jgi:hypothetical protein